jgi:hypothetical protein
VVRLVPGNVIRSQLRLFVCTLYSLCSIIICMVLPVKLRKTSLCKFEYLRPLLVVGSNATVES